MNARLPKSWNSLPQKERDRIVKILSDAAETIAIQQIEKEEAQVQKIWISYACIVLHNAFGFDKDKCMEFIGNWKMIYRKNKRLSTEAEQKAFIEKELAFFEGEYPSDFVDSLERV